MNTTDIEHDDMIEVDVASEGDPFADDSIEDDGLPDEVRAELEALAATELAMEFDGDSELEQALASAQREVSRHREETRAVLARYRQAILAAEPDLPPELVRGETLEELDAAITAARDVVARVRERVQGDAAVRGFPVGAPGRDRSAQGHLTSAEKIARGLEGR